MKPYKIIFLNFEFLKTQFLGDVKVSYRVLYRVLVIRINRVWPVDKISWSTPLGPCDVYKMTLKTLTNAENY